MRQLSPNCTYENYRILLSISTGLHVMPLELHRYGIFYKTHGLFRLGI